MSPTVRAATPADAGAAVEVLRASISELCRLDHRDDPATLERWLRNKTPEHFLGWLRVPGNHVVVAEDDGGISGVGAIRGSGDLDLCYVRPGRERTGVGQAIVGALEAHARALGLRRIQLLATATGRPFYERQGYVFVGEEPGYGVLVSYRYVKDLDP